MTEAMGLDDTFLYRRRSSDFRHYSPLYHRTGQLSESLGNVATLAFEPGLVTINQKVNGPGEKEMNRLENAERNHNALEREQRQMALTLPRQVENEGREQVSREKAADIPSFEAEL
jgi:hypothetical protein